MRVLVLALALFLGAGPGLAFAWSAGADGWWQGLDVLEEAELEAGYFPGPADSIDSSANLFVRAGLGFPVGQAWEARLGLVLNAYDERGFRSVRELDVDFGETFVRYRDDRRRITAGAQTVIWGRVDVEAPTDQIAIRDLRRGLIGELSQRRRAALAVRWEEYLDPVKLDVLWMPVFRPAVLPPERSLWYPINRRSGRILGLPRLSDLVSLLRASTIDEDDVPSGSGGGGIRLTRDDGNLDWGLSVQRVRSSTPYFELDPRLQSLLPDNVSLLEVIRARRIRATFQAVYPWTTVVGGDLAWAGGQSTWRLEGAWLSDIAATSVEFGFVTRPGLRWAAAWEHFPEWADLRINVQLSGEHVSGSAGLLESGRRIRVVGDVDYYWARQRWRARLRYLAGIDHRQFYLNPELSRLLEGRGELYLAAHWFDGQATTLGGLYQDNDLIAVGWRRRF